MSPAAKLTRGPIAKTLSDLAIPTFFGIITILSFNLVDTYFVGLLGTIPLAAISFTIPVSFIVMNLAMGLGIGTSASLARLIGEGRIEDARRFTTHALLLSVVLVVALAIVGIVTIDPLFKALGAEDHLLSIIREFMTIWYGGVGFLVIPMVGNAAIRATGDTRTPSKIMAIAGVMNGIVDPLLIFGLGPFPKLGVAGAAISTVIAWMFSCCASIWTLYHREKLLDLNFPSLKELFNNWKPVLHIGIPASATNMLAPISTALLTALVARYGHTSVAGFGVGSRIEPVALVILMALSSSLTPFIGQNLGAGLHDRIKEGVRISYGFSLAFGTIVGVTLALLSPFIGMLFSEDENVRDIIQLYLIIIPPTFGAQGLIMLSVSTLNSMGRAIQSLWINITRLLILGLPLAYLGSELMGIKGIFFGTALANIAVGAWSAWWVSRDIRKL